MQKILSYEEYLNHKADYLYSKNGVFGKGKKKPKQKEMHLTFGAQYNGYMSDADIVILFGNRGSGKTADMLMMAQARSIGIKNYNGYFFRKEVKDSTKGGSVIDASKKYFTQFGQLRESLQSLDWRMTNGSRISFHNYSAPIQEFKDKVQGAEVDDIFIDEVWQIASSHFDILMANLRNTKEDKRPQIIGAGNPAQGWLTDLISPYIDFDSKYHTLKPEMSGKKLYFFQVGDSIRDVIYGHTREEVYANAKEAIDELVANANIEDANPLDAILSISCTFVPRNENVYIMKSKGGGLGLEARMQKMSLQERIYAIYGGFLQVDTFSDGLVGIDDLNRWFGNTPQRSGFRCASMDMSGKGKHRTIMTIYDNNHIEEILTTDIKDAKALYEWTIRQLTYYNVPIDRDNFIYDSDGLGWAFSGYFTDDEATPFSANVSSTEDSKITSIEKDKKIKVYKNAKAQAVAKFIENLRDKEFGISIDENVLYSKIGGKTIKAMIEAEVKGLAWRTDGTFDGVKALITTKDAEKRIGYHADLIWSIIYRYALDIAENNVINFEELQDSDVFDDIYVFCC